MVDSFGQPVCEHIKQNNIRVLGWTWESNPGPNGYQPAQQPLCHLPAFVIMIIIKYNIKKTIQYDVQKKPRTLFELPNHVSPPHHRLR